MIDADLLRAYEADGVVCLRQAFDAGWLAVASDAIEQGRANPGRMYVDYSAETTPGIYYGDFWTWPQVPATRTFIFESPAARLVGEVMSVNDAPQLRCQQLRQRAAFGRLDPHRAESLVVRQRILLRSRRRCRWLARTSAPSRAMWISGSPST